MSLPDRMFWQELYPEAPGPKERALDLRGRAYSVGTEAVELLPGGADNALVYNDGPATVWVGGADVTAGANGKGTPITSGGSLGFETKGATIWAIAETAGNDVRVLAAERS
jgi:hypothetical protein